MNKSLFLATVVCTLPLFATPDLVNGGFESNGGAGTSIFTGWTVVNQDGSSGSWYVQTGDTSPLNGLPVAIPPEGSFAAMTDSSGPNSTALIQDFVVDPAAFSVILTFQYFLNNLGPDYIVQSDLDYNDSPNQQARVDILSATAGAFDTSVLLNVFQTQSGDPLMPGVYQTITADITSAVAGGGAFQLRFAEVDTQQALNFGVDDVHIDATIPEPSTIGLTAAGALFLGLRLRRRAG